MALKNFLEFELFNCVFKQVLLIEGAQSPAHDSFCYVCLFRHRIDILDFDKCLHVLLKHARKEGLKLVAAEELEDFPPFRGLVKVAQVRPHVATQNTEGRRLANTVSAHETQDLACSGSRQSVQFEAVGSVAVRHLTLKALRQIDDFDRLEGTPLDAHAAAVAKVLRDEADGRR